MKTGIIYCPKHAGFHSPTKRWQEIEAELSRQGIEYDLVQSESAQSVQRLVTMMLHNDYKRIIIIGGDTAFNIAINCLMTSESAIRNSTYIGLIPNGIMNDFASFWDMNSKDTELVVQCIKNNRVRKIDVGVLNYTDKDGVKLNHYFVNGVNIGLIATIQRLRQQMRKALWSRKVSFLVSLVLLVFQRMDYKLKYTIDYETEKHNLLNLCIGNASCYGLTPNAVPYNGLLDVSAIKNSPLTQLFEGINLFVRGKIMNHRGLLPYRCSDIDIEISKGTPISIDGRQISTSSYHPHIHIGVEEEAINLIIP